MPSDHTSEELENSSGVPLFETHFKNPLSPFFITSRLVKSWLWRYKLVSFGIKLENVSIWSSILSICYI